MVRVWLGLVQIQSSIQIVNVLSLTACLIYSYLACNSKARPT